MQICREDRFCPGGGANVSIVCPDGKYSLPGSDDVGDCLCPAHAVSRQNARFVTECICNAGYYKEFSAAHPLGGWYCRLCLPGEFCFNNTNRTCPTHSSSHGVAKSYTDCFCNPGYKNVTEGARTEQAFCENCPANYYCLGQGRVDSCVVNAVSPIQSVNFTSCYCDWGYKGLNNTPCVACQSPTFCYGGIEAQCSEGTFSFPLAWSRLNCSCIPGRWGPAGGPCILCSAGKYNLIPGCKACSNTSDVDCELCALGTFSTMLGRNSTCDVCSVGKFSFPANTRGATSCGNCADGTFALVGSSNCTSCPAGTFGVGLISACTPCAAGKYSLGGATACIDCSVCSTGFYNVSNCISSANTVCARCSDPVRPEHIGRYFFTSAGLNGPQSCAWCCFNGLVYDLSTNGCWGIETYDSWAQCGVRYMCPLNSRTSIFNPSAQSACRCNAGYAGVGGWNATLPRMTGQIEPPAGWDGVNCRACVSGKYNSLPQRQPDISETCFDCITGTYSTIVASARPFDCTLCHAGTFQTGSGANSSLACTLCQEGKYQTGTGMSTSMACLNCQHGTYQTGQGMVASSQCLLCLAGKYSTAFGAPSATTCADCPAGTYSTSMGEQSQDNCSQCVAGTYSSSVGAPTSVLCSLCHAGTYSLTLGSTSSASCISCQPGTFSTTLGAPLLDFCLECLAGTFALLPGASACQNCPAGSFNPTNFSTNCSLCEPGRYSTGGTSGCLLCSYGTFTSASGRWDCSECSNGNFAENGASQVAQVQHVFHLFQFTHAHSDVVGDSAQAVLPGPGEWDGSGRIRSA